MLNVAFLVPYMLEPNSLRKNHLQVVWIRTVLTRLSPWAAHMNVVNIHEAKTHLSRLVEQAARGESFVIAKAGKPLVKVTALDVPDAQHVKRLGFMAGQLHVPDDFDQIGRVEIEKMFELGA